MAGCCSPQIQRGATSPGINSILNSALANGDLSDVQLAVGRDYGPVKIFPTHKNILSMRSPVFRAMFYGSLPESCDRPIDVPDVHPEAFANMLSYFYIDRVDLNHENVFPTQYCADRYDVPLMVDLCSQFVFKDLDTRNCLTYLDMALKWHADAFMEPCLKLIDAHAETVLGSEPFSCLDSKTMESILQRSTLQASENIIYTAVEKWAAAACARNNEEPTPANRRRTLGELLFLVRFPLMSDQELLDGPAESNLLSQAELWDIYRYKHATAKPEIPFSWEPRLNPGSVPQPGSVEVVAKSTVWLPWYWIRKIIGPGVWLVRMLLGISGEEVPERRLSEPITIVLRRGENGHLGFYMGGGRAGPNQDGDLEVFVQRMLAGASAERDGRLKHGDQIVRVNGERVLAATFEEAASMLHNAGNIVTLEIIRGNHKRCVDCS
ncbi:BTB/POZ domain-containing protein 3-like [Paramacrobiotus metropolitanus]|uniref:BTB/POZ domain-containing protein 3-like n=1 Tax=Paramacrobiotus metropolitanus TaxID=2943436 RepID=UPI0024459AA3|nr:BTB/POZ domain-containing protein 3-like [Paramacrobiotus metropolitanus]